jgi:hypothetical protein
MNDEFGGAGVHPLKKLRRQPIEEFEDSFEGKPSATVVRMKPQVEAPIEPSKPDMQLFTQI